MNGEPVARPQLDAGQTGIDACYRLYQTQRRLDSDRRDQAPNTGPASATRSAYPELIDDDAVRDRGLTARDHRQQLELLLAPRFLDEDGGAVDPRA